jgi:hypothetical protein
VGPGIAHIPQPKSAHPWRSWPWWEGVSMGAGQSRQEGAPTPYRSRHESRRGPGACKSLCRPDTNADTVKAYAREVRFVHSKSRAKGKQQSPYTMVVAPEGKVNLVLVEHILERLTKMLGRVADGELDCGTQ